jgi:hypothetical protein
MSRRSTSWVAVGATVAAVTLIVPPLVAAQDADDGFDGYIQSGTCAAPTDALRVKLDGAGDHDIEPYLAKTGTSDETVVLGYYGSPGVPGFGFSAIYTDQEFSLVITDTDGEAVACGDILEPDADRFGEAGIAVVQLLPVAPSTVQGVAVIERAAMERELNVTPTRVRVLLSSGDPVSTPATPVAGFDGYIQGGTCDNPGNRLRVQLKSRSDHDVEPFLAIPADSDEPVTVAYYGSAGAPGFGLAAAYTDREFSLVVTGTDTTDPVACGDILEPDDDDFADAGLALVQLQPVDESDVQGFALIERIPLQRELDVTPTRVRIVLFAPPVASG